mmetsp:Transcript_25059/g.35078  ORF Transcript_25059/g.35078 Transcript_25059/m.35078 type:complete len:85 (+) Transcript_25059:173-427(+)
MAAAPPMQFSVETPPPPEPNDSAHSKQRTLLKPALLHDERHSDHSPPQHSSNEERLDATPLARVWARGQPAALTLFDCMRWTKV